MKVAGLMIKLKDMEYISTLMAQGTKVNGGQTSNMDKERNAGLIMPLTKESISLDRNTVKVSLDGQMVLHMRDSSSTTISKASEHISGLMAESFKGCGKLTRCMDLEFLLGLTGDAMRVLI